MLICCFCRRFYSPLLADKEMKAGMRHVCRCLFTSTHTQDPSVSHAHMSAEGLVLRPPFRTTPLPAVAASLADHLISRLNVMNSRGQKKSREDEFVSAQEERKADGVPHTHW